MNNFKLCDLCHNTMTLYFNSNGDYYKCDNCNNITIKIKKENGKKKSKSIQQK